ncbi:MAG: hypothetical protein ACRD0P_18705 [Stackebrandtia sp.]
MSNVRETAALLPEPRAHLRALTILDTTIGGEPQFCYYTFDTAWGPGEEAALHGEPGYRRNHDGRSRWPAP